MKHRVEIINFLLKRHFPGRSSYLEIGVSNPEDCYNYVEATVKRGVDPGLEYPDNPVRYPYTSDEFFRKLEAQELDMEPAYKWDIIFIDGLHLAPQVWRDVQNSLNHIKPGGFVLLHDVNPPTSNHAHSDHERYLRERTAWNGTVWKVMYHYRTQPGFNAYTVNIDWGVGVIDTRHMSNEAMPANNPWMEYSVMAEDRKTALGLIDVETFKRIHE